MSDTRSVKVTLTVELLEQRTLLAANVTLEAGGRLLIEGSDDDDRVHVSRDHGDIVVRCHSAGQVTEQRFDWHDVERIRFNALDGDDGFINDTHIRAEVLGGAGADTLVGGRGRDTILGGSGDDVISGRHGRDFLAGGADNDQVFGDDGDDEVHGGPGRDTIDGGAGDNQVFRRDSDVIQNGGGTDTFFRDDEDQDPFRD